jgi:hypothetical protein
MFFAKKKDHFELIFWLNSLEYFVKDGGILLVNGAIFSL